MAKGNGNLKIEYRPIGKLMPYQRNARTHSAAQVDHIVALIKEFGWTNPILVDGKNGILAGHGRLQAAKQLGMRTVPVIELQGLSVGKKRAYILADNKAAQEAGWDKELLALELGELKDMGIDLALTGFNLDDFALDPPKGPDEPPVPPLSGPAIARTGEVWQLGRHRLACGKAEDKALLDALMDTTRAHLVFTDPPYGVSYESPSGGFELIKGDELRRGQLYEMLHKSFINAAPHVRDEAAWYVWHASATRDDFSKALRDTGLMELGMIIWAKPAMVLGWADYRWSHEPCFYAAKQGVKPAWYGGQSETTVWRVAGVAKNGQMHAAIANGVTLTTPDGGELYVVSKPPAGRKIRHMHVDAEPVLLSASGTEGDDVWEVSRDVGHGKTAIHPTQKPVELARRAMRNSTQEGENVLDLFAGSGSTLMAGEQLQRNVYAMDLDPLWVDAIIRRWQDATGSSATLEGRTFAQVTKARAPDAQKPKADQKKPARAKARA